MDPLNDRTREFLSIAMVFAAVVVAVWGQRRRLRPWYFMVAGAMALISIPITVMMLRMAKAGEFTGWGGLSLVIVLLPAALVAASSVTALITMSVLLPFYGFDTRTREQRRVEKRFRRSRAGQYMELKHRLNGILILIAVAILMFRFGYLRPRTFGGGTPDSSMLDRR